MSSSDLTLMTGDAAAVVDVLGVALRDGVTLPFKTVFLNLGDAGAELCGEGTDRTGMTDFGAFLRPPYFASASALIFGAERTDRKSVV